MSDKVEIIIFDEEELTRTLIQKYMKEVAFEYEIACFDEFETDFIPKNSTKKSIIIVNINSTDNSVFSKISELAENKNNLVLLISYDKSADLQVKAMRAGAKDFLHKPLIQSDFVYAINKMYKSSIMTIQQDSGAVIYSVISLNESVGKTFFTFNLAKELADISKEKVLYVDFNNNLNDIYTILGMNSDFSTLYYVNKIEEQNAKAMFSKLPQYKKTSLYVMGNGFHKNVESTLRTDKLVQFLSIAKKHFKYILIDNTDADSPSTVQIVNNSTKVYIVMEASTVMADKVSTHVCRFFPKRSVRIIINKYNAKKEEELINKIEQKIGRQVFAKIPKNVVATSASYTKGISLGELSPDLDVVKTYKKLASYMMNRDK